MRAFNGGLERQLHAPDAAFEQGEAVGVSHGVSLPVELLLKVFRELEAHRAVASGELVDYVAVAVPGSDMTELFGRVLEADIAQQIALLL